MSGNDGAGGGVQNLTKILYCDLRGLFWFYLILFFQV